MPIFGPLAKEATHRGLKFLVIGGHAVASHGYVRTTEDVDLLAAKEDKASWQEACSALGYAVFHDGGTFLQLKPTGNNPWRLDIMFVSQSSFEGMFTQARSAVFEEVQLPVPSLDHLLALKFHAMRHASGLRVLKDFDDVIHLIKNNGINVQSESFRDLVAKYGTADLYAKLVRVCAD